MNARLLALALLAAGCTAEAPQQSTPEAVAQDAAKVDHGDGTVSFGPATYRAIEPGALGVQAAPTIWQALTPLAGVPESMEGRQGLDASIHADGGAMVAVVARWGLLDDAVSADETRVVFEQGAGGWTPTAAYQRQQCRRERQGQWTTEACP
jgi:hypothetical protein